MYKVGVMIMGRADSNNNTVKEIVMEVEAKTKIRNLFEYLLELDKIADTRVYIALEKKGRGVAEDSTVSQLLRHTKPTNGLIRLYLYEQSEEESQERVDLKRSRNQSNSSNIMINPERRNSGREGKASDEQGQKRCCCF
jgi:hypothetical protein